MLRQVDEEVSRPPALCTVMTQRAGPSGRCDKVKYLAGGEVNGVSYDKRSGSGLSPQVCWVFVDLTSRRLQYAPHSTDSCERFTQRGQDEIGHRTVDGRKEVLHQAECPAIPAGGDSYRPEPEPRALEVKTRPTHQLFRGNRWAAELERLAQRVGHADGVP